MFLVKSSKRFLKSFLARMRVALRLSTWRERGEEEGRRGGQGVGGEREEERDGEEREKGGTEDEG